MVKEDYGAISVISDDEKAAFEIPMIKGEVPE